MRWTRAVARAARRDTERSGEVRRGGAGFGEGMDMRRVTWKDPIHFILCLACEKNIYCPWDSRYAVRHSRLFSRALGWVRSDVKLESKRLHGDHFHDHN